MSQPSLRVWPGVAAATVLLVARYVVPLVAPAAAEIGLIVGFASAAAVLVWWLIWSRAPWIERIGALVLMVAALAATRPFLDVSIATGGMGALQYILALPLMCLTLVAWAAGTRGLADGARRAVLPVMMLLTCGSLALLRTGGIGGGVLFELHWRWTPTAEERLLARTEQLPTASARPSSVAGPAEATAARGAEDEPEPLVEATPPETRAPALVAARRPPEWPGFRGPARDGVVHGIRIDPDWQASPPAEIWRRAIGPGWSSFAVDGDRIYTQEQRGDNEIVACYSLLTGEPLWMHLDATRFWESNGGPGPRGTPTLSDHRVYAFGATGVLNALDADSGAVVWQRDARTDTGAQLPDWGFASSPLVMDDVVIVAVGGQLVAYDRATGVPSWMGRPGGFSYSSPQLATIDGVPQVLLLGGDGARAVAPSDGSVLWKHDWAGGSIVQPAVIGGSDILINAIGLTGGAGTRRLAIEHGPAGWSARELWTSNGLKPYFNDFVVHDGYAYGFDGSILSSIDLADGHRAWKGGRYGAGQLILLADQHLLLVLTEEGGLALVDATPDGYTEIARAPAIEGKTWNHPALVGDVLLVRNGEEMAAFRLTLAAG